MTGLKTRIFSALLAIAIPFSLGFWAGPFWLQFFGFAVVGIGVHEYTLIAFDKSPQTNALKWFFFFCALSLLVLLTFFSEFDVFVLTSSICVFFFSGGLWLLRSKADNPTLMSKLSAGAVGLLYFTAFPALALRLISLPQGSLWFTFLLLVVFFGDTFAYFGGSLMGQRPLMPSVSPKKTIEGSYAGLIGSCVAGTFFVYFVFPSLPLGVIVAATLICGFAAQSGDLFVSLVKRVASVKDSGRIMPGHGGVLDRLDGVYMASPLVFALVQYCEPWLR